MAQLLAGARKYGLGLVLAHQDLRQLEGKAPEVGAALMGNAGTRVSQCAEATRMALGSPSSRPSPRRKVRAGDSVKASNGDPWLRNKAGNIAETFIWAVRGLPSDQGDGKPGNGGDQERREIARKAAKHATQGDADVEDCRVRPARFRRSRHCFQLISNDWPARKPKATAPRHKPTESAT